MAFDTRTGSMTVRQCALLKQHKELVGVPGGIKTETRQEAVFSTSAVLRGGEYTVLGSTGRQGSGRPGGPGFEG